ncbi:hypothetical protein FQR65_LT12434 [Abscondita terminalis]|nr:hypothetical protein FQR65_LT12434 [Abscondita terminalis]
MFKVIVLFVVILNINTVYGIRCYTCTTNEFDSDKRCATNPDAVEGRPITNCNKLYCTIVRVEYTEPKGKLQSINRDCVDQPIFTNVIEEYGPFRVYYTACRTDLCNGGSGRDISEGNAILDDGEDTVLYVLGIRENSTVSVYSSITLIMVSLIFVLLSD